MKKRKQEEKTYSSYSHDNTVELYCTSTYRTLYTVHKSIVKAYLNYEMLYFTMYCGICSRHYYALSNLLKCQHSQKVLSTDFVFVSRRFWRSHSVNGPLLIMCSLPSFATAEPILQLYECISERCST